MSTRKTGQVIKRSEGVFTIRIFLGRDAGGKRQYDNERFLGTLSKAKERLTEKLSEKNKGVLVKASNMTLGEFLDKWFSESIKHKTREQTAKNYAWLMGKYVRPTLGAKRLSNISTLDVQKLWNQMMEKGLTPRTVRYTNTILKYAFRQAIQWSFLSKNPCEFCVLPRDIKKERLCLSPEQTIKFLKTAKDSKHFCLFLLAIETGLRPSEFLGLKWQDINFEKAVLSVQRTLLELPKGKFRLMSQRRLKVAVAFLFQKL
ncbi:MAG: tyrosine-type recombinase/integrase [Pyrinomonadaceae bacterium]